MKKHIFIIVRYSLLTNDGNGWKIGNKNQEKYKEKLFNSNRLTYREQLFQSITLPSIINQIGFNSEEITLLVLTSNQLPEQNLENLRRMLFSYKWAKLIPLPNNGTMSELIQNAVKAELANFKEEVCYSTVRLDDDDALDSHYLKNLYNYLHPGNTGYCISFPRGYLGFYNNSHKKFEAFYEEYYPKIALGLASVNTYYPEDASYGDSKMTVFSYGSHVKVDQVTPTILDASRPLYLRTIHPESDSNNEKLLKKYKEKKKVDNKDFLNSFSIDKELVCIPKFENNICKNDLKPYKEEIEENIEEQVKQIVQICKNEDNEEILKLKNLQDKLLKELRIKENLQRKVEKLISEKASLKEEINKVKKERNKANRQIERFKKSKTWKLTMPFRRVFNLFRRKK